MKTVIEPNLSRRMEERKERARIKELAREEIEKLNDDSS